MFSYFHKICLAAAFVFIFLFFLASCGKREEMRREAEYTVCGKTDLPDELAQLIEKRKGNEFQLVYENTSCLYLAAGYGKQDTDNYAVAVKKIEETEKEIYADFILTGADRLSGKKAGEPSRYPYIVVCLGKSEKEVLFP